MSENDVQNGNGEAPYPLGVFKALKSALKEVGLRESEADSSKGIFLEVFLMVMMILEAIKEGNRKNTIDYVASLESYLGELHKVLSVPPFGNPASVEEFRRVVEQIKKGCAISAPSELPKKSEDKVDEALKEVGKLRARVRELQANMLVVNTSRIELQNRFSQILEELSEKKREVESLKSRLQNLQTENGKLCEQLAAEKASAEKSLPSAEQFLETLKASAEKASAAAAALAGFGGNCSAIAEKLVEKLNQKPSFSVPKGMEERLEDWLKWQGEIIQATQALSGNLEEIEPLLQEAEARESIHLHNGESNQMRKELEGKINSAQNLIGKLVQMKAEGDATHRKLRQFVEAARRVQEGLADEDLKDPPLIPDVESFLIATEELAEEEVSKESEELSKKEFLEQVAAQNNLSPRLVFVITLYDLVDENRKGRGISLMLLAAEQVGIFGEFGWADFRKFYRDLEVELKKTDIASYLVKAGTQSVFARTSRPLPWNVQAIVSSDEARQFNAELISPPKTVK